MRVWKSALAFGLATSGALALLLAGSALGQPAARAQGDEIAVASLVNASGAPVGVVTFTQDGPNVKVSAEVKGLPAGFHGFHIHAVGTCDASTAFMSAGGHYNPGGATHADHAGDMPSLYFNSSGSASATFATDRFAVADLFDADGSAVMVHADRDNFGNIPARYGVTPDEMTLATGDAGARSACGVVSPPA